MNLAVEGGGIVARPEEREEVGEGANFRVELDPDDFDVICRAGADQFVIRVVDAALGIADLRLDDAGEALEGELDSPETAGSEMSELVSRVVGFVEIGLQGRIRLGGHCL